MINLLSGQRRQIVQAAASLAPSARDAFICDVTATIDTRCGGRVPNDFDVNKAINDALNAAPWPRSVFMCDSVSKQQEVQMLDNDDNFEVKMVDGRPVRILKDGGRMSFGLFTMDQADAVLKNTVAAMDKQPVFDAAAHRPGHRLSRDVYARDGVIAAYSDYQKELVEAYKSPHDNSEVTGQGSGGFSRDPDGVGVEGDSCKTGGGDRGRLVDLGEGRLVCVAEPHASSYLGETSDAATKNGHHRVVISGPGCGGRG
jgi:hypothetical protein